MQLKIAFMKALKTIQTCIAVITFGITSLAQVPEGFNYMAIARNGDGDPVAKTDIGVRIAILDADATVAWEEEHSVTTDDYGLFHLVIGDPAALQTGGYEENFADINWAAGNYYVSTSISLVSEVWIPMGSAQLFSVPYALVSKTTLGGVGNPFTMYGDTVLFMNPVHVKSSYNITEEEALFAVKRKDGQTMFAVYNQGVRINIPMIDNVKGPKGGFAIGGFGTSKADYTYDLFTLNKDSVRIYLDKNPDLSKGPKGGFAIGGFDIAGKAPLPHQNYLFIAPDSARIYVKNPSGKGPKGGFAIGGFSTGKGTTTNFMDITPNNYFIGHETGIKATVGDALYNSVIGFQAARALTTGDYNTILGYKADSSLTSGNNNIIIGATAGFKLTSGQHNTLIGSGAGFNHTSQQYNIMIGTGAGYNLTGSFNNFIGINAGNKIKPGTDNLFVGTNAGAMLENGYGNTIIGIDAGRGGPWDPAVYHPGDSTSHNTIVGNRAGAALSVGHNNVFIGYNAGAAEVGTVGAPASNKLYIANSYGTALIYGDFSSGRIGLGTLSPAYKLDVAGDINITGDFRVNGSPIVTTTLTTGDLTATGPISVTPTRQVVGGGAVISVADASTTIKGAVQLSNKHDGTNESLATTEKALKDGLATKVTGNGNVILLSASGPILESANGDIVLIWDNTPPGTISINNKLGVDVSYWWTMQRFEEPSIGSTGSVSKELTVPIIQNVLDVDLTGFEIHLGPIDGSAGWTMVWIQAVKGNLIAHYISF